MTACIEDHNELFENTYAFAKPAGCDFSLEGQLKYDKCEVIDGVHNLTFEGRAVAFISGSKFKFEPDHETISEVIFFRSDKGVLNKTVFLKDGWFVKDHEHEFIWKDYHLARMNGSELHVEGENEKITFWKSTCIDRLGCKEDFELHMKDGALVSLSRETHSGELEPSHVTFYPSGRIESCEFSLDGRKVKMLTFSNEQVKRMKLGSSLKDCYFKLPVPEVSHYGHVLAEVSY